MFMAHVSYKPNYVFWNKYKQKTKIVKEKKSIQSVYSLSHVQLFVIPSIAARQASLSITNSRSPPKLMYIESVMPSSHLILCHLRGTAREGLSLGSCSALCRALGHVPKLPVPPP